MGPNGTFTYPGTRRLSGAHTATEQRTRGRMSESKYGTNRGIPSPPTTREIAGTSRVEKYWIRDVRRRDPLKGRRRKGCADMYKWQGLSNDEIWKILDESYPAAG